MNARKLTLKKDTLHELGSDELSGVVGGITTLQIKSLQDYCLTAPVPTQPVLYCVTKAV